jgi:hypothetical protein
MKVSGKPVQTSVGVFFLLFALVLGILLLPDARHSQSPLFYVIIPGGLFVAIPAILGIAVILENLRKGRRRERSSH